MRILAVVQKVKKTVFDAQFVSSAVDSTGNFTVSNVNGVTFSGGSAVWAAQSPVQYLVTNESGFTLSKNLTVKTRINDVNTGIGKPVWTVINTANNSYIRLIYLDNSSCFIVQVNGVNIMTGEGYPSGVWYDVEVILTTAGLVEIYIDGLFAATGTVTPLIDTGRKLYIGYSPTVTMFGYQGQMDYITVEEG